MLLVACFNYDSYGNFVVDISSECNLYVMVAWVAWIVLQDSPLPECSHAKLRNKWRKREQCVHPSSNYRYDGTGMHIESGDNRILAAFKRCTKPHHWAWGTGRQQLTWSRRCTSYFGVGGHAYHAFTWQFTCTGTTGKGPERAWHGGLPRNWSFKHLCRLFQ